ncbi:MAG TPA: translocation/assembly module TamB domain-containing protein [Myxococcales bacterium]|nr:translocation/assembly module TamB domain-containing protein [Myxococcales bacterium]
MSEHPPEPVQSEAPAPRPPAAAAKVKPLWRRIARLAVIVGLAVLAFLLLAIGAGLVWLHTGNGAEELGRFVANEARNSIAGDLKVKGIQIRGFLHVCVDNVELRDPENHKVAAAERACISVSPLALKAHRIELTEVELVKPWLEVAAIPGTKDTTLSRAIAAKKAELQPKEKAGEPFVWVIDVKDLKLRGGSVAMRPALGAEATFALNDLDISDAHALYAADAAAAKLKLQGQLAAPGKEPVALELDATIKGAAATGVATINNLKLKLGQSGLTASGSWDIAKNAGELHVTDLVVNPKDLETMMPPRDGPPLLAGVVRGSAIAKSDGKSGQVELHLDLPKGKVQAKATATLEKEPAWDLQLMIEKLDPGAATALAPHGDITARASLHGKGTPQFDKHGVQGDLEGVIHVGPAQVDRMGAIAADLSASVKGRQGLVKAFTATALGLKVQAHGEAAFDALKLDLLVDAPDLAAVGKAVGVLTRQKPTPIAGSLHLGAHLTGSATRPDANLHLRAPSFRFGPTLAINGLAVDGELHGKIETPSGALTIAAQRIVAGSIDMGAPKIAMNLEWPLAHLRIGAGVQGGNLQIAGDAAIDDDKDGVELSNFIISYPGNQLKLAKPASVHFRDEIVVEPIQLTGDHGSIGLQAKIQQPPGRIDAQAQVSKLDLAFLPSFALPKDLALHGLVDLNAVVSGPRANPDVDVKLGVSSAGARPAGDLSIDAQVHGHVHDSKLKTEGEVTSGRLLRFTWNGEVPVTSFAKLPDSTPLQLDAHLDPVDIGKLADALKIPKLQEQKARGEVALTLVARGTLGAPRATVTLDAQKLGTEQIQDIGVRTGVLLDKNQVALDGTVTLGDVPALGFTAGAPFELRRALREKTYSQDAIHRTLNATVVITQLDLARLVKSHLLPEGSAGTVNLTGKLGGTPLNPTLQVVTAGESVSVGRLHGLGFQGQLDVGPKVKLTFGAQSQGDVVATVNAGAALSGAELVELAQRRKDESAIGPLLDRQVTFALDIPGLPIARASQLAGRNDVAEGRLTGHIALAGTAARPQLKGQIALKDLASKEKHLGSADFYVEADSAGALVHLGVDPPGGGNFLAHAKLKADLGGRTLLASGADSIINGHLDAEVKARQLDLAFLSGLAPGVRRAGGKLDMDVKASGPPLKALPTGELHLKSALFDVVGQGVYDDVGMDATFSPKEVVIDRITGSTGPGTFSTVLVASRKVNDDPAAADSYEFSGEIHLGDAESVKNRKNPDGSAKKAGAVPVRQAGEARADVTAEVDLFGDYSDGLLHANAKIPEARIVIGALPDKKLPKLKPNDDIFIVEPGQKEHRVGEKPEDEEAEAEKNAGFRAHAKLEIKHLYVKAEDFEFPVESNLTFDYDAQHPDDPTADGTIHVPNGSFNALGRRFTIVDAKITETGGDIADPELEVKALYENPQANVTITVSGTATDPKLDMTSNPAMDQDAIAFFLATGRIQGRATQSGGGVDLSGAATSVLGSLLFGQVRKELASVLPVDVLTIETGSSGVSEASVGKYIGDHIFIGYKQRLTTAPNENTSEGRIEYGISKSVAAEATVGDRNSDISVLYTKDF